MGFLTLAQFRTNIASSLGGRGVTAQFTDWVNLGYFDAAGAVDFPELDSKSNAAPAAGTGIYPLASSIFQVVAVYDPIAKYGLRKVAKEEYFRQDNSEQGVPRIWTRHGSSIYTYPVSIDDRELQLITRVEPAALAADGDKTVLPRTWDAAVLLLATSYALQALNEDARATLWYNRAITYMRTRLIEGETNTPQAKA